jgi:hypothetical protein
MHQKQEQEGTFYCYMPTKRNKYFKNNIIFSLNKLEKEEQTEKEYRTIASKNTWE